MSEEVTVLAGPQQFWPKPQNNLRSQACCGQGLLTTYSSMKKSIISPLKKTHWVPTRAPLPSPSPDLDDPRGRSAAQGQTCRHMTITHTFSMDCSVQRDLGSATGKGGLSFGNDLWLTADVHLKNARCWGDDHRVEAGPVCRIPRCPLDSEHTLNTVKMEWRWVDADTPSH